MPDTPLAGTRVLVTRPRRQAAALVEAVESAGGEAIRFPVIEVHPRDRQAIETDVRRLADPDICVFVSANAVRHGLDFAGEARLAAIGPATAAAIESLGKTVDIQPAKGYASEQLLAKPELAEVAGKTVRIVRGGDGRELLATDLERRGARVEYLSVYERRLPPVEPRALDAVTKALISGKIAAIVVMSVQSLDNLLRLLPEAAHDALCRSALVTPSERVIKVLLHRHPDWRATLAQGPQAGDLVAALVTVIRSKPGKAE